MFGRSVEYKAKCRVIFINSIYILLDNKYPYDSEFKEILNDFINYYAMDIQEVFELMYDFKYNKDKIKCISDNPQIDLLCIKYLSGDLKKVYDGVRDSDIELISKVAELFYEYISCIMAICITKERTIKH